MRNAPRLLTRRQPSPVRCRLVRASVTPPSRSTPRHKSCNATVCSAAAVLQLRTAVLHQQLLDNYPVRGKGDTIDWAKPQWVEGDNEALHYRGRELKRGKMWFQSGDPRTEGFVKYYYTGWQRAVLPATCDVACAPELVPVVERYNDWAAARGKPAANHFIVTHYVDG